MSVVAQEDLLELAYRLSQTQLGTFMLERRRLELSFRTFIEHAWPIIEPTTPFVTGPHIDALCLHLQAVTETHERLTAMSEEDIIAYRQQPSDIRRLIINIPPRSAKSTLVSVLWPAWEWTRDPSLRYLTTSYNQDLAERDSIRMRTVVESEWYQERWGHKVQMSSVQNKKYNFQNTATGGRQAIGVGGGATGGGGDRVIADDPHNVKQAESELVREETLSWWDQVMSTRLNDPKRDALVVVMQRVHESDLSGHLIRKGGWVHLKLPNEYEGDPNPTPLGWKDWRTRVGEFMSPARFGPDEKVMKLLELGPVGYAGQYQQRPVPIGGATFLRDRWQRYDIRDRGTMPAFRRVGAFVDTAFKTNEENDYSVLSLWGITQYDDCYLLDLVRGQMDFPDLLEQVPQVWQKWRRTWSVTQMVVEDKGSGTSLIQTLRKNTGIPVVEYKPDRDKIGRANAASGYQHAGKLFLPTEDSAPFDVSVFLDEHGSFPRGEHDDIVDTTTMMLLFWVIAPPEPKKRERTRTGRLLKTAISRNRATAAKPSYMKTSPRMVKRTAWK